MQVKRNCSHNNIVWNQQCNCCVHLVLGHILHLCFLSCLSFLVGATYINARTPGPAGPKKKRGINATFQRKEELMPDCKENKNYCQTPKKRGITARHPKSIEIK